LPLIEEFEIRPILAVVPDNRDIALQHSPPDPEFWDRMRRMEAAGATIALHGYHHNCNSNGRSLVPLRRHTEFAGIPEETQRKWIRTGLRILRNQGLNPRIWVAPRHGFDRATLCALQQEGINLLSDGFARVPFIRYGLIWIPQQLWTPEEKPKGLWTICLHVNTASGPLVDQLRAFLDQHAAQFTSVDRVLAEFPPARLGPDERLYEAFALWRARSSRIKKRLLRRFRRSRKG
jgi:predicted deacetylase